MPVDQYDREKEARLLFEQTAFDEAWNFVATRYHWPNDPQDRKAASMLLARLVDSHVKAGLERAVDVGLRAFEDYKKHHGAGSCKDCHPRSARDK